MLAFPGGESGADFRRRCCQAFVSCLQDAKEKGMEKIAICLLYTSGLFGMLFFVTALHMSYSLLAGTLTVAIMVLPTVLRTTEEALMAVPDSYREGSFGLGAGKLRTIFKIVLPSAIPGILSGVILATGRIAGETAALILSLIHISGETLILFRKGLRR